MVCVSGDILLDRDLDNDDNNDEETDDRNNKNKRQNLKSKKNKRNRIRYLEGIAIAIKGIFCGE